MWIVRTALDRLYTFSGANATSSFDDRTARGEDQ
jgi:hypothetical protein